MKEKETLVEILKELKKITAELTEIKNELKWPLHRSYMVVWNGEMVDTEITETTSGCPTKYYKVPTTTDGE